MPAWKPRSRRTCTSEVATVRSDFAQRVRFTINDTIKEVERLSPRDIRGDSAATAQGHKTDDPDYCVMAQIRQQRLKHLFGVQIRKAFATWRNLAHKSRIASELQDLPSRSPQSSTRQDSRSNKRGRTESHWKKLCGSSEHHRGQGSSTTAKLVTGCWKAAQRVLSSILLVKTTSPSGNHQRPTTNSLSPLCLM